MKHDNAVALLRKFGFSVDALNTNFFCATHGLVEISWIKNTKGCVANVAMTDNGPNFLFVTGSISSLLERYLRKQVIFRENDQEFTVVLHRKYKHRFKVSAGLKCSDLNYEVDIKEVEFVNLLFEKEMPLEIFVDWLKDKGYLRL